jgi:transposase InsO family protein
MWPVKTQCRCLKASRSGYYRWLKAPVSNRKKRDIQLKQKILAEYAESKRVYGSPRLHAALKHQGESLGRKRVVRLMNELQIHSVTKRKFKATTNSKHNKPVANNLLNRDFNPIQPNDTWVADITYIRTRDGWLYLSVVIDLFSRKVVGWSTSERMTAPLVIDSLEKAIKDRRPKAGLLFHSDQGVQYALDEMQNFLANNEIVYSMSIKGECYDNAVAESFFDSLKSEWLYQQELLTRTEAKQGLFEYIEIFYNRKRLHSTLGYLSPVKYESLSFN